MKLKGEFLILKFAKGVWVLNHKFMRIKEKIKSRLNFYLELIKDRNEIKNLYHSFDEATKKEFLSILRFNLIRTFKSHSLSKLFKKSQSFNFYNIKNDSFIFEGYIFKSARIDQNLFGERYFDKVAYDIAVMIKEILIDKVYEDGEVKVEPEDIVLDCGANIGIFSIYAAKNAKMVYAFEPSENEVTSLYENKKLNNCNNIKIIHKAVLDISKNAKLCLVENASHFIVSPGIKYSVLKDNIDEKMVSIKTISIDEFVKKENLERVDFIKMDIEGSEEKALLGAKKTLEKFKPKLAITIYHNLNDFYKLPLLIKRLNPDYRVKVKNKKGTLMAYAF
jgi:FkbM family methyltransferase